MVLLGDCTRSHQHFLPRTKWFWWELCLCTFLLVKNKAFDLGLSTEPVSTPYLHVKKPQVNSCLGCQKALVGYCKALSPLIGFQTHWFSHIHSYQQKKLGWRKAELGTQKENCSGENGKWDRKIVQGAMLREAITPTRYLQPDITPSVCVLYGAFLLHT